ncbi:hypothetical protein CAP47_00915 [Psychroflexus sp. S27]|uniref:AAA family ATPase n=1 Tax=Psychroflexus sp. S27 TaxID=1982757 RepID=UPI000C2B52B9|nr:AAA family ATPase [Psychroflexus sp. S27]PJX28428.1 hypothetical protein CAP47_00915 [Psychroflexus sp. S27]
MKILKIKFKNINSLKGDHEIDFTKTPFTENNLFAITGPTGSGKTTLLDVISLALFNQVPRLGKMSKSEISNKGAILTRNQKEASAEVTYSCQSGIYRSQWNISTARTGNLRDYEMSITDISNDKSLDYKKGDVPAKNEELIGLNYDQFIKSVVLAQGEFAKFLKVKKEERGELLEKITGTGIYRRLGQTAFYKYRDLDNAVKKQKDKISTHKEVLISEKEFEEKEKLAQETHKEKEKISKLLKALELQINDKRTYLQHQDDLEKFKNQIKENEDRISVFEKEKGVQLKKHNELQAYIENIQKWKDLNKQLQQLESQKEENRQKLENVNQNLEQNKDEFASLFGLNTNDKNFEDKLVKYKETVRKFKKEREEILTAYKTLANSIDENLADFKLKLNQKHPSSSLQEVQDLTNEILNKKEELEKQYSFSETTDIEYEQKEIKEKLKQIWNAEKCHSELSRKNETVKNLEKDLKESLKEIENYPAQIKDLKSKIQLQDSQLEAKESHLKNAELQKKLEDYRIDLKPNEPCPLCGSLDHPLAENHPKADDQLEKEIQELTEILNKNKTQLTQFETKLETVNKQNSKTENQLESLTSELDSLKISYQKQFENLEVDTDSLSESKERLENKSEALNDFYKYQQALSQLQKSKNSIVNLEDLLNKGRSKKEEIEQLFEGDNFENKINQSERNYLSLSKEKEQLDSLKSKIEEEDENIDNQYQKQNDYLKNCLEPLNYENVSEAIKHILPHQIFQKYQDEKQTYENQKISLNTSQKDLSEQIDKLKEKVGSETIDDLKENYKNKQNRLQDTENQLNEFNRLIKNQKETLQTISDIKEKIGEQLKINHRWKMMNDLIGDSKGKKFNDYAQNLTLSQLLVLANERLRLLTDRYQIDKAAKGEDDSLIAIDAHMGGQRRSVKTLSGGEAFIMSLALALALSDFASRKVEINSLFIDEGFGTLDPETLDQTLDTLEVLQAKSSKTIGIISHVSSLKERISTQIQLTQNGQGYSTLKVI